MGDRHRATICAAVCGITVDSSSASADKPSDNSGSSNKVVYRTTKVDASQIERTILDGYDWETSPDTPSTWRIGDGTAPFYNYIYLTVGGFSEHDTFRSNQIREGLITRDQALAAIEAENQPRVESFKWYCDTVGIDAIHALEVINRIPKLYAV